MWIPTQDEAVEMYAPRPVTEARQTVTLAGMQKSCSLGDSKATRSGIV